MKYRQLSKSGLEVSAIGMGRGAQPIRLENDPLEAEMCNAVARALELGINFFDSSDAYWNFRHETLLGRALKGKRAQAIIATKFGYADLDAQGEKVINGRPEYAITCCENSLKRLGIEVIDLYYLHRVDPNVPVEDTVGAMAQLVKQGKVRHIGICHTNADNVRRAHKTHPLAVLQSEYSLWNRVSETAALPVCRELGIAFVPFSPLGRGLLTGRIKRPDDIPANDRRRNYSRFKPEVLAQNTQVLEQMDALAAAKGVSPSQLALAWLLAQGDFIVPIPGTNHKHNIEANAAVPDVVLSNADLARLDALFPASAGSR